MLRGRCVEGEVCVASAITSVASALTEPLPFGPFFFAFLPIFPFLLFFISHSGTLLFILFLSVPYFAAFSLSPFPPLLSSLFLFFSFSFFAVRAIRPARVLGVCC